jgi:putative phosphoesterase
MKIGLISDLHIDINSAYSVLETVAETACKKQLDFLVIAGDISETPYETRQAILQLQKLCRCKVYYVPGNHDMWHKNCPDESTDQVYKAYVSDENCLCGKTIQLRNDEESLMLTGDIGWYDYSFASDNYTKTQLDTMSIGGRTWQDRYYNQWTKDNCGQMQIQLKALEEQLKVCGNGPILAVTHMLPIRDFCVPESKKDWGFFNAFLGSELLEKLYQHYPVRYAVCGHVHYRSLVEKEGITYICPCLGYYNEWPLYQLGDDSVQRHVEDAMYVIDDVEGKIYK